ncbi:hypothetical protein D9B96_12180, partial [Corynebacterium diphtheriae]
EAALGFDADSYPFQTAAMQRAVDTGQPSATGLPTIAICRIRIVPPMKRRCASSFRISRFQKWWMANALLLPSVRVTV